MTSFFDTIVDIYDETRGLPKETMKDVTEVMADELKDSKKVLEIGIGTGRLAEPLQRTGIEVIGIDISLAMLKKANLKGLDLLVRGDVCNLPFQDSSFDSVISVHVLHLIEDCDKALSELKRVAKEKLLSVLYLKSDFNVIDEYIEALKNCGYILELPGISERDIKEKIPPKREVKIQGFKEMHILRERIKLLEEKKHSFTAHVPPKTHECAIRYLKNKHADKLDMLIDSEIEIVAWDIVDLPDSIST